jgi:prepilin-type N-terminal cleavage/methylation domain-containing protein
MTRQTDTAATAPGAQKGFTLVEILVAMTIFLAGMTGILALLSTALALHRDGLVAAQVARQLDAVAVRVEAQLAAGDHWNDDEERMVDVELANLPDGTTYAVRFVSRGDGSTVVAWISAADQPARLARATPVPYLMSTEPDAARSVERYRALHRR